MTTKNESETNKKEKSIIKCENCGNTLTEESANEYWQINKISSMFSAKELQERKIQLCNECLKYEKRKNTCISLGLLILFLLVIIGSILVAIG